MVLFQRFKKRSHFFMLGAFEVKLHPAASKDSGACCLLDEVAKDEGVEWASMMHTLLQVPSKSWWIYRRRNLSTRLISSAGCISMS